MTNKEYTESIHQKDTAGFIVYDLHCPYCVKEEHASSKLPPQGFKDVTEYK